MTNRRGVWRMRIAGISALANGIALLGVILAGIPLPVGLVIAWAIAAVAIGAMVAGAEPASRRRIVAQLLTGLGVGLVATIAYDIAKALLSTLDPSPYNPFEAAKVFGHLLLGESAPLDQVTVAGWAFHLVNGCTFAVAFAMLFAKGGAVSQRRGALLGVAWGLFLETFQLVLYPGWLNVRFLDEFRQISFLSHVVFGLVLGLLAPAALRRIARTGSTSEEVSS